MSCAHSTYGVLPCVVIAQYGNVKYRKHVCNCPPSVHVWVRTVTHAVRFAVAREFRCHAQGIKNEAAGPHSKRSLIRQQKYNNTSHEAANESTSRNTSTGRAVSMRAAHRAVCQDTIDHTSSVDTSCTRTRRRTKHGKQALTRRDDMWLRSGAVAVRVSVMKFGARAGRGKPVLSIVIGAVCP